MLCVFKELLGVIYWRYLGISANSATTGSIWQILYKQQITLDQLNLPMLFDFRTDSYIII